MKFRGTSLSDYFNGDILVGPDNVMFIDADIKGHYINSLNSDVIILKDHLHMIDSLQNITKKKESIKKLLKSLIFDDRSVLMRTVEPNIDGPLKTYAISDPYTNKKISLHQIEICNN